MPATKPSPAPVVAGPVADAPPEQPPQSLMRERAVLDLPPEDVSGADEAPISGTQHRRPVLASEALMEDLAPVEPARQAARVWSVGVGAGSLVVGTLAAVDLLPGGVQAATPWWFTGAIAVLAGLTPVSYRRRAIAMVVLGLLSCVVALQGAAGALMHADGGVGWGIARLAAAVSLPGALLFRARYRAYAGTRIALGAALGISLALAIHSVISLFEPAGLSTVGAVLVLSVLAASLAGFMGAETTGAGAALAPAAVGVLAADLALRAVSAGRGSLLGIATGAVAFGGAAGLASLGVFQILAWRFAADARRIDIHSTRSSAPPDSSETSSSDWSTRD